ncbi:unnamed protein product [Medioppia subpectinata]|uniref:Uncharacterized protein n=1 Tax=Medioppia subpectinata TaxID=1979941 RepID=A0A7R9Q2T3_9ACAR|nr:unnamed protein product [Medioppia subpectinata]CAG2110719.1 unnamed protein product [Medioppia subpectinata]
MMNRLRTFIRDDDLDKFDELIYKREEQAMLKSKTAPEALKFKQFKQQDSTDSSFDCPDVDGNDSGLNHNEISDENDMNDKPMTRYLPVPHDRVGVGGVGVGGLGGDDQPSDDSGAEINNLNFSINQK